jgi:hypothetical protein
LAQSTTRCCTSSNRRRPVASSRPPPVSERSGRGEPVRKVVRLRRRSSDRGMHSRRPGRRAPERRSARSADAALGLQLGFQSAMSFTATPDTT